MVEDANSVSIGFKNIDDLMISLTLSHELITKATNDIAVVRSRDFDKT